MSGCFEKKKIALISTIVFLVIQLVVLAATSWVIDSMRASVYNLSQAQTTNTENAFRILLRQQSLQLEGIKGYFFKENHEASSSAQILKDKISTTYNFTSGRNIYLIDRQTGEILYPLGSGSPTSLAEMAEMSLNPDGMVLFANDLLRSQDFTHQEFLISLRNEPNATYAEAQDFTLYPIGTLNRNFVQKIILPRPAFGEKDYVVVTAFSETLIREIAESPQITNSIESINRNTLFLISILATVLVSAIVFSIINIFSVFQIYTKER